MHSKSKKIIIPTLIFLAFILGDTKTTLAESVIWTTPNPMFVFSNTTGLVTIPSDDYTDFPGALKNVTANVKYNTRVLNAVTGEVVSCGSTVPVGTRLKFEFMPHQTEDISWFGTGGTYDSPYGTWKEDAAAPDDLCIAKNYIKQETTNFAGLLKVYADFSVQPPNKSITGLSLNCTDVGINKECLMDTVKTYDALFQFSNTYGKFYYGISNTGGKQFMKYGFISADSCREHSVPYLVTNYSNTKLISAWHLLNSINIAMGIYFVSLDGLDIRWEGLAMIPPKDQYQNLLSELDKVLNHVKIDPQEISCPIKVVPVEALPTLSLQTPSVSRRSCLTTQAGTEIPYTFQSVNTGKRIKFLIDWNNDGVVDQILPPSGYTSEASVSTTRIWSEAGSRTFSVMAIDEGGSYSSKTKFTNANECEVPLNPFETDETTFIGKPGELFEGGIRQILTNKECVLDIDRENLATCTLTKENQYPVNVDISKPISLIPGRYNISCNKSSGQVLSSRVVCLYSPDLREI